MAYNLGTAQGNIRIEYDSRGVARARDDMGRFVSLSSLMGDNVDRDTKKADRGFTLMGVSMGKTLKIIGLVGLAFSALQNAIVGVVGVTQALLPIIEAGLALLPSIILAAAGAAVVLKVAMAGVGDAIKAAFAQDLDKFNEALKKLAPEAQNFAKALFEVVKQTKPLQQALQNELFKGTAPLVAQLSGALNALAPAATGVARAFNSILVEVLKFVNTPVFIDAVTKSMQGMSLFLEQLAPAFGPLLTGFSQLAAQGGQFFRGFGDGLAGLLAKFGEFLGQVDLASLFERAGETISFLIDLFKNLGSILGSLVGAFSGVGVAADDLTGPAATLSNSLGLIVKQVADFLSSAEGTAALHALATAFSAIADAAGDVLLAALKALAPILVAIAPLATVLARVLGAVLTSALETLAPIVLKIAEALNASLGPALPVIMDAVLALIGPIGQIAGIFGGVLAQALQIIGPLLAKIAPIISEVLVTAIEALLPNLEKWGQTWLELSEQLLPAIIPLLEQIGPLLITMAPLLTLGANVLLSLLIPAMQLFVPVAAFFINMLTQCIAVIRIVVDWVIKFAGQVSDSWNSIAEHTNGLRSSISSAMASIGAAFSGMVNAVRTQIGNMIGFVRGIPGQIQGALGNLASMLFGAGQDVIQGLINGIKSMIGAVANAAKQAVAAIPGVVKNVLGISSPSKVTAALGREVSAGLAKGILDTAGLVRSAVSSMAGMVPTQLTTTLGVDNRSAVAAAVGAGSTAAPITPAPVPVAPQLVINQTVNPSPGMNEQELANETLRRLAFSVQTGTSSIVTGVA